MDEVGLIETLSKVAPVAWEAALRQAYIIGVQDIVWGIVSVIAAALCGLGIKYQFRDTEEYPPDFLTFVLLCCGVVIFVLLAIMSFSDAFTAMYNPNYYAARLLLGR